MFKKKIKVPLYNSNVVVMFYNTPQELQKEFKDYTFEIDIEHFDGALLNKDGVYYIMFLGDPSPGIIAHEAKHLVNRIFIDINHELCRYNDEPEAYLLGWIVDEIHKLKDKVV